jgi:hypothetical protein
MPWNIVLIETPMSYTGHPLYGVALISSSARVRQNKKSWHRGAIYATQSAGITSCKEVWMAVQVGKRRVVVNRRCGKSGSAI